MQDKTDDAHAGVKSTALLFKDATKPWLSGFAVGAIGLLGVAGKLAIPNTTKNCNKACMGLLLNTPVGTGRLLGVADRPPLRRRPEIYN